jgi:hypothetical protein
LAGSIRPAISKTKAINQASNLYLRELSMLIDGFHRISKILIIHECHFGNLKKLLTLRKKEGELLRIAVKLTWIFLFLIPVPGKSMSGCGGTGLPVFMAVSLMR